MQNNKRYSNATFTKRVDHDAGEHRPPCAASEPARCKSCGAIYSGRRWVTGFALRRDVETQYAISRVADINDALIQIIEERYTVADGLAASAI